MDIFSVNLLSNYKSWKMYFILTSDGRRSNLHAAWLLHTGHARPAGETNTFARGAHRGLTSTCVVPKFEKDRARHQNGTVLAQRMSTTMKGSRFSWNSLYYSDGPCIHSLSSESGRHGTTLLSHELAINERVVHSEPVSLMAR